MWHFGTLSFRRILIILLISTYYGNYGDYGNLPHGYWERNQEVGSNGGKLKAGVKSTAVL